MAPTPAMQLPANEERRKRKAFADIGAQVNIKASILTAELEKGRIYASDFSQNITGIIDNRDKLVVKYNYKKQSNIYLMHSYI